MNNPPPTFSPENDSHDDRSVMVAWRVLASVLKDAGLLEWTERGGNKQKRSAGVVIQLASDSRMIDTRGTDEVETACFVAITGTATDGHDYIDNAIANGAGIVVCERIPEEAATRYPEVLFAKVRDGRTALAELAADFYGHPSQSLSMIGVTGTNGKTTVAYLVHHALKALGQTSGLISTIEVRTGAVTTNAALTTPGALDLQRTLRHMVDEGCSACAMEVSSHALDQERTRGVDFDIGIFTNLTSEHLDYHGTLSNYRNAKKKLFDGLSPDAVAVLNADDDSAGIMGRDTSARVVTYGTGDTADVQFDVVSSKTSGLDLRFSAPGLGGEVDPSVTHSFRLAGRFNAYNLAAAFSAVVSLDYDANEVLGVLRQAPPVPGRFDQISFDDGTTVVVDYAHTPDALENILRAVRETTHDGARLWCLFGCGGDRDASKRRTMGSLAETLADRVIVTSDNPRTEDPGSIMNDIRRGMSRPGDAEWIADRDAAIRFAADHAAPGDIVLIAGKGHETYQVVGSTRHAFDDREKARTYFHDRTARMT